MKKRRRLISLLVVLVAFFTIFCWDHPVRVMASEDSRFVIHFKHTSWAARAPNIYIYGTDPSNTKYSGNFPGVAMALDSSQGDGWYTYDEYLGTNEVKIIFYVTDTDRDPANGQEGFIRRSGEWWYLDGVWYEQHPDPPVYTDASISPAVAAFDRYPGDTNYKDITVALTPESYTLTGIAQGGYTLVSGTDYTVSSNVYTIKAAYLKTLPTGQQIIAFNMSGGTNPTLAVTVSDSTPQVMPAPTKDQFTISPAAVTYNGKAQGVTVTSKKGVGNVIAVYYNGLKTVPTNAGSYTVTIDAAAGTQYSAVNGLSLGTFTINKAAPFTSVTSIRGVPTKATVGTSLTLKGTVEPSGATNKTITWTVKKKGTTGATISGGKLKTTGSGTAVITATVKNGNTGTTNYTKDFTINVTYPIKKGSTYTVSGYKYKVISITNSKKEVEFTGLTAAKKKTATTVDIKNTVKINGITMKVTSVGANALKGNAKVKTIKIENNVQTIRTMAFYRCTELKSITIGTGLKTMGSHVFWNDKKLKNVTIKSTKLEKVGTHAFYNVKATVKVPSSRVAAYKRLLRDKKGILTIKK